MSRIFKSRSGEGYIDTVVVMFVAMLVIVFAVKLFPVFVAKNQLTSYATEICREAELSGRIGSEVSQRAIVLSNQMRLAPVISWEAEYIPGTNQVQLNNEILVTVEQKADIGFFSFGSFPINLTAKASGKSEVYWK